MKGLLRLPLFAALGGILVGALLVAGLRLGGLLGSGRDPETIAAASLQSMREQARLAVFSARSVAVVTASQTRFGLRAEKTLIMPGTVRYELDLAKLQPEDLEWNAATNRLDIALPPIEIAGPEIDLGAIREYGGGGVLSVLTDAERRLDAANRARGQAELIRQARESVPMALARDAAIRAVERSFAMPLRAAGIDAKVAVRFRGEPEGEPSRMDRSRRMEDVLKERGAKTS